MTARAKLESGNTWTDKTARLALPVILQCAKNGLSITYSDLDKEISRRSGRPTNPMVISYGRSVGKIGDLCADLSKEWGENVPPLNAIVVSKTTELPSYGVHSYIKQFLKEQKRQFSEAEMVAMTKDVMESVFDYPRLDDMAAYFDLRLVGVQEVLDREPITAPKGRPAVGGPESEHHKSLKQWVASHPSQFTKYGAKGPGTIEARVDSGDELDVLFKAEDIWLGVEVKARNADEAELWRGVFQCVKYRATLRAMRKVAAEISSAVVLLVIEQDPSAKIKALAKRLRVNWKNVLSVRHL